MNATVSSSGLTPAVAGIVLVAALLHAMWNALAHGVADRLVGFALIGVAYTLVSAPAALLLGPPPAQAWPFVAASAVLHVVYTLLLWASYELGDLGVVYPLARGTAPLVVVAVVVVGGQRLPLTELLGVLVIGAGLLAVALGGGRPSRASLPALGAAVATGVAIAGYTVVDAVAVGTVAVPTYAAWMFLLQGPVLPLVALVRRGRALLDVRPPALAAGLGGSVVSLVAYGLVLVAQTSGATAAVAALRETSIVWGVVIGAVWLGEGLGVRRALAACVVLAGMVLLDL